MKRFLFGLLFFIIAGTTIHSQGTKTDGPTQKLGDEILETVIGNDNSSFFVMKKTPPGMLSMAYEKIVVQSYDKKTFNKNWEKFIEMDESLKMNIWGMPATVSNLTFFRNGLLHIFLPGTNKKRKGAVLVLYTLDVNGKIMTNGKEIAFIPSEMIAGKYMDMSSQHKYCISKDSSKMVYWIEYQFKNYGGVIEQFSKGVAIDLKSLTQIPKSLPDTYLGSSMRVINYSINNEGKIAYGFIYPSTLKEGMNIILTEDIGPKHGLLYNGYWTGTLDKFFRTSASGTVRINYSLGIFDLSSGQIKVIHPNYPAGEKSSMEASDIFFYKNDRLVVTFVLTNRDKHQENKPNSSIYIGRFDLTTGKADFETSNTFSEEWRAKHKPGEYADVSYDFNYTVVNDGTLVISAFKRGGANVPYNKYVDDAQIIKITSNGKIVWIKTLPIRIKLDDTSSKRGGVKKIATYIFTNNKLYYIFNDEISNEKNINLNKAETGPETKEVVDPTDSDINTTCLSIDLAGNITRTLIGNNKEAGLYPLDKTIWLDNNKVLLYFSKYSKTEHFSSLTIQ
jgi:hypothetical protein